MLLSPPRPPLLPVLRLAKGCIYLDALRTFRMKELGGPHCKDLFPAGLEVMGSILQPFPLSPVGLEQRQPNPDLGV